jgi:superfamily II DNA or RNA helicase
MEFGGLHATVVDPQTYRRLELEGPVDHTPWAGVDAVVTSLDFVKQEERIQLFVTAAWDVIIIDEAHVCTAGSQRGRLLHILWDQSSVRYVIAVTAAPRFGRLGDFEPLRDSKTRIVRRSPKDLVDWEGKPLLAESSERKVESVPVSYSASEVGVFDAVKTLPAQTDQQRFGVYILLSRATSSLFALEQSLRRLLAQAHEPFSLSQGRWDEDLITSPVTDFHPEWATDYIPHLLELIEGLELDSKWTACSRTLEDLLAQRPHVVLFSEFRDTAFYVHGLLRATGHASEILSGTQSPDERLETHERFRDAGGVLVTTMVEGMNHPFVKACVHYDLPSSPAGVAQRFGRIHRINAPPGPVTHRFMTDAFFGTDRLLHKLLTLETDGTEYSGVPFGADPK